jgi:hypothetical protein
MSVASSMVFGMEDCDQRDEVDSEDPHQIGAVEALVLLGFRLYCSKIRGRHSADLQQAGRFSPMRWSLPNCFSTSRGTMEFEPQKPAQCSRSWALEARNAGYAVLPAQSLGQSHGADSRVNCVPMTSSTATPFQAAGRHLQCQLANLS